MKYWFVFLIAGAALADRPPCDFKKYPGKGCERRICFQGTSVPCGPPRNEEEKQCFTKNAIGDGLCHPECKTSAVCGGGKKCEETDLFRGDVKVFSGYLCRDEK